MVFNPLIGMITKDTTSIEKIMLGLLDEETITDEAKTDAIPKTSACGSLAFFWRPPKRFRGNALGYGWKLLQAGKYEKLETNEIASIDFIIVLFNDVSKFQL